MEFARLQHRHFKQIATPHIQGIRWVLTLQHPYMKRCRGGIRKGSANRGISGQEASFDSRLLIDMHTSLYRNFLTGSRYDNNVERRKI
jgi:hypothetical protein